MAMCLFTTQQVKFIHRILINWHRKECGLQMLIRRLRYEPPKRYALLTGRYPGVVDCPRACWVAIAEPFLKSIALRLRLS